MMNRRWVLAAYPKSEATEQNWRLDEQPVASLGEGEVLVRTTWLSVDPYMRGKINRDAGMAIGDVMDGGGVGEVVESRHPGFAPGDMVEGLTIGWQEYAVVSGNLQGAAKLNRIPADAPAQAPLSWLGMPGLTAYFAMTEMARPQPGDTVVVSGAAGAVGQIAGQIAKLAGAHVIGVAGSDAKLAWCREIGFDATINYRKEANLAAAIARIAPKGVNIFFDGTGGAIHDAVLANLAQRARVTIVGKIAVADRAPSQDIGLRASARLIATRATIQGFVVFDYWDRRAEATERLSAWHRSGVLRFQEDVVAGFENVPAAFVRMMRGENFGKQLVSL